MQPAAADAADAATRMSEPSHDLRRWSSASLASPPAAGPSWGDAGDGSAEDATLHWHLERAEPPALPEPGAAVLKWLLRASQSESIRVEMERADAQ